MEAVRCGGEPPKRLLKNFINVILIFFSAARMSVCTAAPSPCLPSKNVFPPKRLPADSTYSRNVFPPIRRIAESAGRRFGGNVFRRFVCTFRRQRFSAFRLHVVGLSGRLCGAARGSADRRPTRSAETLKRARRAKRGWQNRTCSKSEHPRCSTWSN